MSNESADGGGVDAEVPEAVMDWLSSVAAQRDISEAELLQVLLSDARSEATVGGLAGGELSRLEQEFRSHIEDVRERVIQVKRETDDKAPADHTHHNLRNSLEQLGRELGALEAEVEQLDERIEGGFENFEEIVTYLTETTDELNRRLGRVASSVIELRERMGEATRDEARRTALSHLTETANRSGVERARCEVCDETVDISLLIEPRCPHCDSAFSTLEPKTGFFRTSVLHTGTLPALESAEEPPGSGVGLESLVDEVEAPTGDAPTVEGVPESSPEPEAAQPTPAETADDEPAETADDEPAETADEPEAPPVDEKADGVGDLEDIRGIGPAYAERLESAGVDGVRELAVADPDELGEAIGVSADRVADWVEQADARVGSS